MPRVTVAGHPLHPQIVAFPIGLITFSFAMDCMYAATDNENYAKASQYSLIGGAASAVAAATVGVLDYLAIPNRTEEKKLGTAHGLLNAAVLALGTVNLLKREDGEPTSKTLSLVLGAISVAGLTVSQWYGGHLVYEHGVRVKGKKELDHSREIKPSFDEKLEKPLHKIGEKMPAINIEDKAA